MKQEEKNYLVYLAIFLFAIVCYWNYKASQKIAQLHERIVTIEERLKVEYSEDLFAPPDDRETDIAP